MSAKKMYAARARAEEREKRKKRSEDDVHVRSRNKAPLSVHQLAPIPDISRIHIQIYSHAHSSLTGDYTILASKVTSRRRHGRRWLRVSPTGPSKRKFSRASALWCVVVVVAWRKKVK